MNSTERQGALLEILDEAIKVDRASFGLLQVCNPTLGGLELVAHRGFDDSFLNQFRLVRPGDPSTCGRALRLGKRVLIPDVTADPYFTPFLAIASRAGFRAVQSTPIVDADGRVLGILSTHFSRVHYLSRAATLSLDQCAAKAARLLRDSAISIADRPSQLSA